MLLLTNLLLATAIGPIADTTLTVRKGQRLEVSSHAGSITIRTWNRDVVKVEGETGRRGEIEVDAGATTISVEASSRHGGPGDADIVITMPVWMAVEADGVETDITIEGCRCAITAETVNGDITVRGGEGSVDLQTVEGSVTVSDVNGRLSAESVNDDVTVSQVNGEVRAETVNGDIILDAITSSGVDASTVNGDIRYVGTIQSGGHYDFSTHQGDLTIAIPENTGASITVNTFDGSFESDFPVTMSGRNQRKKFSFTLGNGSARMTLESFGGDIRIVRPGSRALKSKGE